MPRQETKKEIKKNDENVQEKGTSDEIYKEKVLADQKVNGKLQPLIINYLINSLNSGYAPVVAICGRYGSGKSMTALRILEKLHNEVGVLKGELTDPRNQLVYDVLDFLKTINTSSRRGIIFDDAGVNLNALDFQKDFNRAVEDVIATQRLKENVYIFVLGKLYKLTKGIRDIIDLRLVVNKTRGGKVIARPTIFRPKYGKIDSPSNTKSKIYLDENFIPEKPDKELVKKYRKKERKFKSDLVDEWIEDLEGEKEKKEEENKIAGASEVFS